MNSHFEGPVMKRVVNVKNMKFNPYSNSLESKPINLDCEKKDIDLHNFQPTKDVSYTKTIANRKLDPLSYTSMVQTSELDLDDDFTIRKLNPLFQSDEDLEVDIELEPGSVEKDEVEKKTALELMFERIDIKQKEISETEQSHISKIEINYKKEKDSQAENSTKSNEPINKMNDEDYYDPDYERILPETNAQSEASNEELKYSVSNENEVYQVLTSDGAISHSYKDLDFGQRAEEDKYSISNFDAISMSSYKIQERKNSEISSKTENIKKEMNDQFISLEIKPTDLLYNLIIHNMYQKSWIAGLKNSSVGLSSKIHFGDELLSINDFLINDKDSLHHLTKHSVQPFINIKVKRLPFARVIVIQPVNEPAPDEIVLGLSHSEILQRSFGIKLKQNTCKIEKILEDGLFYKNGLKYDSNKVEYDLCAKNKNTLKRTKSEEKDRLTKWVITEINSEFINYKCTAEEILIRLRSNQIVSVIVQPYDLVKALFKEKMKFI